MATIKDMVILLAFLPVVSCRTEPDKFLFISSPRLARVMYVRVEAKLPVTGIGTPKRTLLPLIDDGLDNPMGLATDQSRHMLLVADTGAKKVLAYKILFLGDRAIVDGAPTVAVQGVAARWVACDGRGAIFVSDEMRNTIWKVSAESSFRKDPTPKALYSGVALTQVSTPAGVAVDNYHIYWSNKANTQTAGSVVKGFEAMASTNAEDTVNIVASNVEKVFGLCIAKDNLFYTSSETTLFGIKTNGGKPGMVSSNFTTPRGCAWDGDGTVYVADHGKAGGTVLAFASNMPTIMQTKVSKVASVEGAFDVAVLVGNGARSGAGRLASHLPLVMGLITALSQVCS